MNYKYEFERLLATAKQLTDAGKGNIKSGAWAPFTALKNAVDFYENKQPDASDDQTDAVLPDHLYRDVDGDIQIK